MTIRRFLARPAVGLVCLLAIVSGVSGAVTPNPPWTLSISNANQNGVNNIQIVGLYGGVGTGSVHVQNDQDQANNANAHLPFSAAQSSAEVITGTFQTVLPNGQIQDINIPHPLQSTFVTGSTTQTASLMSWAGVQSQTNLAESRAGKTPIVLNGNLTLNADGSITIANASGITVFNQINWSDASNPLRDVLSWNSNRFTLNLGSSDTIIVNGYNFSGTAAENVGLDIRASLTYQGVGAFVVNVASGLENRGIQFEGQAQNSSATGLGSAVSVLASQQGDGLAFITNGRTYLNQQGSFAPTVQGFLYAQGYTDGTGQPHGIDIVGGNLQGMAIGSGVYIKSNDLTNGVLTDYIVITGRPQSTMTIPPQVPGGRPVYTAAISNWRELR